jgi:subtilisin family serine protease
MKLKALLAWIVGVALSVVAAPMRLAKVVGVFGLALVLGVVVLAPRTASADGPPSGNGSPKIDRRLMSALADGRPVDVLLTVKVPWNAVSSPVVNPKSPVDKRRDADVAERSKRQRAFSALKRAVHGRAGNVTLLKSWEELPTELLRVTSRAELLELAADPRVAALSPVIEVAPNLTQSLPLIHQVEAVASGANGLNSSIAVIDTGANYKTSDLGSCSAPGPECRVWYTQDFATNDRKLDDDGHGTNVASIVARVAPKAHVIALDVFSRDTKGKLSAPTPAMLWE